MAEFHTPIQVPVDVLRQVERDLSRYGEAHLVSDAVGFVHRLDPEKVASLLSRRANASAPDGLTQPDGRRLEGFGAEQDMKN